MKATNLFSVWCEENEILYYYYFLSGEVFLVTFQWKLPLTLIKDKSLFCVSVIQISWEVRLKLQICPAVSGLSNPNSKFRLRSIAVAGEGGFDQNRRQICSACPCLSFSFQIRLIVTVGADLADGCVDMPGFICCSSWVDLVPCSASQPLTVSMHHSATLPCTSDIFTPVI